jgi:hypothetical protein
VATVEHAITRLTLVEPGRVDWACLCGARGRCSFGITAEVLAGHLGRP